MASNIKQQLRQRRKHRVRAKVFGNQDRPRLSVFRSLQHISAQLIDDTKGCTLIQSSSLKLKGGSPMDQAQQVGKTLAQAAQGKKISLCVFDRNGYRYHGRVKALAEAARQAGLQF